MPREGPLRASGAAFPPRDLHSYGTPSGIQSSAWERRGSAADLALSWPTSYSLGATNFSSRLSTPRRFLARHRTAMVPSTLANVTWPSTMLLSRGWTSVMMFEALLAKIVHEVSLLHLEMEKKGIGIEPITGSHGGGWSSENHLRRQAALTLSAFGGLRVDFLILCAD